MVDQIKKKTPPDYKDHFLDQWCDQNNPLQLADELDSCKEVKSMRYKNSTKNFNLKQKEMKSNPQRGNYLQNPKLPLNSQSGFPSQSR